MYNFLLYIFIFILVVWTVDGIKIDNLFKRDKTYQPKIFYILLILSLTELVTNFIINFTNSLK